MAFPHFAFRRNSLTLKMVLLTMIVGFAVWALLDRIQTRSLKRLFQAQLTERLSQEALEDRLNFDRYLKAHNHLVRILVLQKGFVEYAESANWAKSEGDGIAYHRQSTAWFPRLSAFRTFTRPRHAVLLDGEGIVREAFLSDGQQLPPSLEHPSRYLISQSHDQTFMTTLDERPYVVASESARDSQGRVTATLMLASPFDTELLVDSQGMYSKRPIALVAGNGARILTSSAPEQIPTGAPLGSLTNRYVVAGQEFYEYGDSELAFSFVSFIPTAEIEALTEEIVSKERRQRAAMAAAVILAFTAVMTLITRRIERLTQRISSFSQDVCYDPIEETVSGDQLAVLENRYLCLQKGILAAQEIIRSMFSSYVSPKVVDELLINPEKARLGAEKREVTILFADLVDFTALSEQTSPEDVVALLNEYFSAMTDIIFRWNGTFDKIVGDEILAFWGAPLDQPDHAELAVRCALDMTARLRELREKWVREGKPPLHCGIGMNTGDVLVGNIGAEGRKMDYTIIGDTVNTTARVEALTREYGALILMTESTAGRIRPLINDGRLGRINLTEHGAVRVKGKGQKVRIFELRKGESSGPPS